MLLWLLVLLLVGDAILQGRLLLYALRVRLLLGYRMLPFLLVLLWRHPCMKAGSQVSCEPTVMLLVLLLLSGLGDTAAMLLWNIISKRDNSCWRAPLLLRSRHRRRCRLEVWPRHASVATAAGTSANVRRPLLL
jgi:hypothetical protein